MGRHHRGDPEREVLGGGHLRRVDPFAHVGEVPVPQLAQVVEPRPSATRGQDVDVHFVRQVGHRRGEALAAGDLEGHHRHLMGPLRSLQRFLDAANLQHVDLLGAQVQRPLHRDRVHDAAIEVVPPMEVHRRQEPGHCAGGEHRRHERTGVEPRAVGRLDNNT